MDILGFSRRDRVVGYGWLAGVALCVIGVRFLLWPQSAAVTFGLGADFSQFGLHYVIGLRDLWLGLLAIVFAWRRSFLPLGLWFLLGAGVCLSDGVVVSAFSGPWTAVAFHGLSGVFCGIVGLVALAEARAA